ncbi:hypothetical protein ACGF0J_13745 [Nonomuraea sp. NPDC047897]|uniref:hypothetical protein n=1 Tax=Nonomuraea sp. NPDC047897 TaxID=3364346 RepID=UPI00371C9621
MSLLAPSPERERARLEAEQLRIQQEELREAARRKREIEEAEHRAALSERAGELAEQEQTRITAEAEAKTKRTRAEWQKRRAVWAERARTASRLAVMSITNLGVNGVAVSGQAMAFMQRGLPPLWAVLAAGIVESVAVYVSWHAHVALREGDAAFVPRMWSYLIGAGAGYLSYTHVQDYPELFAACSLASPWLWSMHSRHLHRKDLREQGLIDPRAPKFSVLRWVLHTGETFAAFKWAVSEGVQSPHLAIEEVRTRRALSMTRAAVEETQAAVIAAQRDQLQLALTNMAALSQELYGMDPDGAAAMQNIARFVNKVGGGMFPMYRPLPAGEIRPTDGVRTDGADERRTDDGRTARARFRDLLLRRGRTADENGSAARTNEADGTRTDSGRTTDQKRTDAPDDKRTDSGRTPDETNARKRTVRPDGKSRPRGRSGAKTSDGGRTKARTVRAADGGRTLRTSGRIAGHDDLTDLLPLGRTIRDEHTSSGVRLTRDLLKSGMKKRGRTIANDRAGRLLAMLRAEVSSGDGTADENASSARTNNADGGPSDADEKQTDDADGNGSSADNSDDKGAN